MFQLLVVGSSLFFVAFLLVFMYTRVHLCALSLTLFLTVFVRTCAHWQYGKQCMLEFL